MNYGINKLTQDSVGSALDQLSTKVGSNIKYKTDRGELDGRGIDIHKWIEKLPRPKAGWTPGKYEYTGAYNPLDEQLKYDPNTDEVQEWYVDLYSKVDEISAYHDICYDRGVNKHQCEKEMIERRDKIRYGEMWGQTARFVILKYKTKTWSWSADKKRKTTLSNSDWSQQLADELYKPITRNVSKRSVISNGIDEIWAADLVEMQKFSKWNTGVKYILRVINVFSKYGWIKPLKDKKTETISKAFDDIFKSSKRKPKMVWLIKVPSLSINISKSFLKPKASNYITLKMKRNQPSLRYGIKL